MKFIKWMIAGALGVILVSTSPAVTRAQGNGNGHGKGHTKHDRDDDDEHSDHYYKHHDEGAVAAGIPRMRDTFLLAWRRKISFPQNWKSNLFVIGGHVVLLNHRTNVVVDIFHFEVN